MRRLNRAGPSQGGHSLPGPSTPWRSASCGVGGLTGGHPNRPYSSARDGSSANWLPGGPACPTSASSSLLAKSSGPRARLVQPDAFAEAATAARRELPADAEAIAALYARYEDEKRRRRVVDFDDLLMRYTGALETDSRFAAAQRWRWRHVFVDEASRTSTRSSLAAFCWQLLGDNEDLFVVGDPNQAIYAWNGADPGFLANVPQRWPGAEVVHLDENHRSTPQVVAAATAVLGRQAPPRTPGRANRITGPLPSYARSASEESEAAGVAAQLREACSRGIPTGNRWQCLSRTNTQVRVICKVLRRAGVPFPLGARRRTTTEALRGRAADLGPLAERVTVCSFHPSPRASSGRPFGSAAWKRVSCRLLTLPTALLPWQRSDDCCTWH